MLICKHGSSVNEIYNSCPDASKPFWQSIKDACSCHSDVCLQQLPKITPQGSGSCMTWVYKCACDKREAKIIQPTLIITGVVATQ